MNKPIEFIKIDNAGKCTLTEEAEEMLSNIDSNLAVITIAGIYRSGKSYLLNRLLGRQDGFEIGPTISSCTKGQNTMYYSRMILKVLSAFILMMDEGW